MFSSIYKSTFAKGFITAFISNIYLFTSYNHVYKKSLVI